MTGKPLPLRLDEARIERLDRIAEAMTQRNAGVPVARANVIRAALDRGMESLEKELDLSRQRRKR